MTTSERPQNPRMEYKEEVRFRGQRKNWIMTMVNGSDVKKLKIWRWSVRVKWLKNHSARSRITSINSRSTKIRYGINEKMRKCEECRRVKKWVNLKGNVFQITEIEKTWKCDERAFGVGHHSARHRDHDHKKWEWKMVEMSECERKREFSRTQKFGKH